ncbi:hypothetical protein [Cohnella sp. GCM10012308]|uniref:hypothetical protein n=1 Tax=Cohnella sp. GCM10012308 TaxID=3317329 RepID=UPI0036151F9C
MELPAWFRMAMQQRLDAIYVQNDLDPELLRARTEEKMAFEALYSDMDETQFNRYLAWEDKHLFKRALEHERFYMKGVQDGAQMVSALLADKWIKIDPE